MLKEAVRICDVCDREIAKGEKYSQQVVPPDRTTRFRAIIRTLSNYQLQEIGSENEHGQIILDLCLDCYLSMSISDRTPV